MRWAAAGLLAVACVWATTAAAAEPLDVVEIAAGVFVHQGPNEDFTPANRGGIANLAFVVGTRQVAVIDSGGSLGEGESLLAAIRARSDLPVGYVIATHVHPDHLFGHAAFRGPDVAFVGHANLAQRLAETAPYYLANLRGLIGPAFAGTEPVAPTLAVADSLAIDLGGRTLELRAWPAAHTDTDLTVMDSATGTLFAGDLLFVERIPVIDGSLLGWLQVMDELERLPAARVVPGHGPPAVPWPDAAAPQRAYLEYLRDTVRAELARNRSLQQAVDEVPPPPGSAWLLVEANHGRNVTAAFTELEWE